LIRFRSRRWITSTCGTGNRSEKKTNMLDIVMAMQLADKFISI